MGQSLQSGHYIAYVRRRPERQQKFASKPAKKKAWIYDSDAAHDGKWFYTSNLTVRECTWHFEDVKDRKAYTCYFMRFCHGKFTGMTCSHIQLL